MAVRGRAGFRRPALRITYWCGCVSWRRWAVARCSVYSANRSEYGCRNDVASLAHRWKHATNPSCSSMPNFATSLSMTHSPACQIGRCSPTAWRLPYTRGSRLRLASLDLDRFKVINESLGHGAGDALLKLVAQRLVSTTRSKDAVARAGGDEFLLLLHDVSAREDIEKLATRWMDAFSEPYRIQGTELHVSPSIGIARYPVDAADGQALLARADEAMYHAKNSGRNMFRFFDEEVTTF